MKTVVVVGAGGSLAQAISLRPSRQREHPPVDASFFRKAEELGKQKASIKTAIASLRALINRGPFAFDPWALPAASMEQFFADVYYEVASGRDPAALQIYRAVVDLYSRVLRETTDWIALNHRMGALGRFLRLEASRSQGDKPTVITFNQDLILENLVAALPRATNNWCLQSLYCAPTLKPLLFRNLPPQERFPHHTATCSHDPPITLLKLHGSLNWSIRTTTRAPGLGTLFPEGRSRRREIWVTDRRGVQNPANRMNTNAPRGRSSWYLWPLVVPPIYDKQRITAMDFLTHLWDTAAARLEEADRLVLLGYSIPDGDVLARQLLRSGISRNSNIQCVDCINPDANMAVKLKGVLGVKVVRLFEDVQSFLDYSAT